MGYVERIFRRDFNALLGIDIVGTIEDLEALLGSDWIKLFHPMIVDSFVILKNNLFRVWTEFMAYNQEKFPNPIDQYIWIYENRNQIKECLAKELSVKGYDQPVCQTLWVSLEMRFDRMFKHMLRVGSTHKFNPEILNDETPLDET